LYVADASVFVSSYIASDSNYTASFNWISKCFANNIQLYVPVIAVVEISGSISRVSGNVSAGLGAITDLTSLALLSIDMPDEPRVLEIARLATTLQLRGMESFYVELAKRLGVPLITWDKEQLTKTSSAIKAYTPLTVP
jgi:predicted nucleic acid-binding protein